MTDEPFEFGDDDWRDAIHRDDPEYPELPEWLERVRERREAGHG